MTLDQLRHEVARALYVLATRSDDGAAADALTVVSNALIGAVSVHGIIAAEEFPDVVWDGLVVRPGMRAERAVVAAAIYAALERLLTRDGGR